MNAKMIATDNNISKRFEKVMFDVVYVEQQSFRIDVVLLQGICEVTCLDVNSLQNCTIIFLDMYVYSVVQKF